MTHTPVRISWSSLRAHTECRQRSFLLRSGKRAKLQDLRSYYHGMVVDRAMVDWLADPHRAPGDMAARVDELIDTLAHEAKESGDGVVRWRGNDDKAHLRQYCIELVTKLEPILRQHVLPHPWQTRKRFTVPVTMPYLDGTPTTINLTGEMDLLVQHDGWVIWDLKGTKDNDYWRKVVGQLVFYDLANLCLNAEPSRMVGLIQPMCTQPVLAFEVTPDMRTVMWSRIQAMAIDIWRDNTQCKDGTAGCSWCEVKHACVRYSDTGTLGTALRTAAKATTT